MKKNIVGMIGLVIMIALIGCQQTKDASAEVKGKMEHPNHQKARSASDVLNKVLEHIAHTDPELSFENSQLLDYELGVPHFNIVPFSEIEHFEVKDVVDGFIVRPVVGVDNPKLLIILEAVDKKASVNLNQALLKVKSDQWVAYRDSGIWDVHLISTNKTVRQGNYLIYATWEDSEEIVKVFERHVQ